MSHWKDKYIFIWTEHISMFSLTFIDNQKNNDIIIKKISPQI